MSGEEIQSVVKSNTRWMADLLRHDVSRVTAESVANFREREVSLITCFDPRLHIHRAAVRELEKGETHDGQAAASE